MERTARADVLDRTPAGRRFEKVTLDLGTVHCLTCAATLEDAVRSLPGVVRVAVHWPTARIEIRFDPGTTSAAALQEAVS